MRTNACPPTPPVFFFNDTATTEIYTLSLHDALPIFLSDTTNGVATTAPTPSVIARLEPGQGASFTGSYIAPVDVCSLVSIVTPTCASDSRAAVATNTSPK